MVVGVAALAVGATTLASRSADRGTLALDPTIEQQRDSTDDAVAAGPENLPMRPLGPVEITSEVAGDNDLLPDAAGLTLVAGRRDHLSLIDLATGDIRTVRLPRSPRPPPGRSAMLSMGTDLIISRNGTVISVAGGDGRTLLIAERQRMIPTYGDGGSIWMTDGMQSAAASTAMRVAPDGTLLERVDLPAITRPVAGSAEGLLVSTPGGVSMVNADGGEEITPTGQLVAADGERIAWVDCEAGVHCVVVLGTVDDPDQARLPLARQDVPAGYFGLPTGTYSPDGRRLAFPVYRINQWGTMERPSITIIDTATAGEAFRVQGPFRQDNSALPLAWSPDSRWLFVASRDGVTAWNADTTEMTVLDITIDPPWGLAVLPNAQRGR